MNRTSAEPYDPNRPPTLEQVVAYLEGHMEGTDRTNLEARLEQDAELDAYVEDVYQAWLKDPNLLTTVESLKKQAAQIWKGQLVPTPSIPLWKRPVVWAASAAAILILVLGVLNLMQPSCGLDDIGSLARTEALYEQQYLTLGAKDPRPIDRAFEAYDRGMYAEAIPLLETLLDQQPTETLAAREMTLCLGVSYLLVENPAQAEPYLLKTRDFSAPRYQQAADWYLALIYLSQQDEARAKPLLSTLAEGTSYYAEPAQRLLPCL